MFENNIKSKMSFPGRLDLILGPMFSGKTSELIRRMRRCHYANQTCLGIKYSGDSRYNNDCIITHPFNNIHTKMEAISTNKLMDCYDISLKYEVIAIDEGQFFEDLYDFSTKMVDQGKVVIIAALISTYDKKTFGSIPDLLPHCDNLDKLTAVCMKNNCKNNAIFSKRIVNSSSLKLIGGAETYIAVCRNCY